MCRSLESALGIGQPGTIGIALNILGARGPQPVVIELRRQQPLPGNGNRHAADVNRDPPPPPLLRNIRRRSGPACRIKHKITGVGGHEHAAFDDLCISLNNINFSSPSTYRYPCHQSIDCQWLNGEIIEIT